ncbi:MAG: thioredoxin-disulfide reductase [Bacteroidales bacterium]|nr:thioredoxin-disulfide reductase [Bacteroidales bacterium]
MATAKTKILIVGSGPAGYTAAIYASRANLKPMLYEGMQPGGQLTTTTTVENFPGFPEGIDGNMLMMQMREQAEKFGADIRSGMVSAIDMSKRPFAVTTDDGEIEADAVIIATGATAKYLGLADEQRYAGCGVSACATCDGFFYRGKNVAVVGGGDTAIEEAMYLSTLAKKVYLIVRRNELRASKTMQERLATVDNIEVMYEHETVGLDGEGGVEKAILKYRKGKADEKTVEIAIDGFFLAIGHKPNTELFPGIETDEQGYIKVKGSTSHTNIEGVFACGDVCDPRYRQAITAAASGCKAAKDAELWLMENK